MGRPTGLEPAWNPVTFHLFRKQGGYERIKTVLAANHLMYSARFRLVKVPFKSNLWSFLFQDHEHVHIYLQRA